MTVSAPLDEALRGDELLAAVKELGGRVSHRQAAIRCGYGYIGMDGSERVNTAAFDRALVDASGVAQFAEAVGFGGRAPSYSLTVSGQGALLVGKSYLRQLKAEPGDVFDVAVSEEDGAILLRLAGDDDDEGDE